MKRIISLVLVCTLMATMSFYMDTISASAASETHALAAGTYAEDEILVVFEEDVKASETEEIAEKLDAESIEPIEIDSTASDEETACLVTLPKGETVEDAIKAYETDSRVAYAQPNYLYAAYHKGTDNKEQLIPRGAAATAAANDDTDQWNLKKIDTQEAWDLIDDIKAERKKAGKEALKPVTVAVLDTGVDLDHEDLQKSLNPEKCVKVEREPTPVSAEQTYPKLTSDDGGHGTKVAGIIGATSGNHKGAAGVAAGNDNDIVELAVIDVYERYNSNNDRMARSSDLIKGIDYAVSSHIGAKVINMSLGHYQDSEGAEEDTALQEKIREVVQEKNVTVVCSAGNKNSTDLWYPSDFPDSISAISTINYTNVFKQCKAPSSSYGNNKDISAPGYQVMVLTKNGGYQDQASGTSFAAPTVAAVAAMIYYVNPDTLEEVPVTNPPVQPETTPGESQSPDSGTLQPPKKEYQIKEYGITAAKVEEILKTTATDLYTPGDDIYTRCGNVNAYAAVAKATGRTIQPKPSSLAAPKLKAASAAYNKVRLTWNKVAGAQGYEIYRSTSKKGSYAPIKTVSDGSVTSYTNGNLKMKKTYYYKICSLATVDDKPSYSKQSEPVAGTPDLGAVTGFKAEPNSYRSIQLSWKKVDDANGYQLLRSVSKNGTYKTFKTLTNSKKTDHINKVGLTAGKTYYYKMRPYINVSGKKVYGETYSAVKSAKAKPKAPTLTVTQYSSGNVKRKAQITWSQCPEVTGYRISRSVVSAKKGFKRIRSTTDKEGRSFIDKNVKKNETYYYRIRAYKRIQGKILYSNYSSVKKIKV